MGGLYFLVSWIVLVLYIPYEVFSYFDEVEYTVELTVALTLMVYTATRLSVLAAQGRPRLLSITFFVFVYVWVGLAASAQLMADDFPWPTMHHEEDVLPALLEIALAIACFELGHLWFRLRPPQAAGGSMLQGLNLMISDRALLWLCVVALGLTLIGMMSIGFGNLFLTRAAMDAVIAKAGTKSETLIARTFLRTPSLIAFTVLLYNAIRRWHTLDRQRKRFYFLMGALMGGVYFVANYPPGQTRFWLGAVILTPAFALPRWHKLFAPMWVLGLAAGLTVVFPYLDLFRRAATVEQAFNQLSVNEDITKKMVQKADYDVFQQTLDGYRYDERGAGASMGENLLGAALFWFPRSIWNDKPLGTGQTVAEAFGRGFTNLSAPLWMEFYYAFGWVGIAVLMLLYARLCAWGESLYEASQQRGAQESLARIMVAYWAAFHMFILRGDLINATAYSAFGYVMLLAAAILPRVWGRKPGQGPLVSVSRRLSR